MRPYIFAERNGIHIIDLVQTARYLNEAYEYVREGAEKGWRFLFVGTKRQLLGSLPTKPPAVAATTSISLAGGHAHQLGHDENPY
jgi:ribosomal protein S2